VLSSVPNLNPNQITLLGQAASLVQVAMTTDTLDDRRLAIQHAINFATNGSAGIGTNLNYQIGDGTVMF